MKSEAIGDLERRADKFAVRRWRGIKGCVDFCKALEDFARLMVIEDRQRRDALSQPAEGEA